MYEIMVTERQVHRTLSEQVHRDIWQECRKSFHQHRDNTFGRVRGNIGICLKRFRERVSRWQSQGEVDMQYDISLLCMKWAGNRLCTLGRGRQIHTDTHSVPVVGQL